MTTKTKRLSRQQRVLVESLPWVRLLKKPQACTGIRYSHGRRPCKNLAYFKFTSLKSRRAFAMNLPNGVYCWSHLVHHGVLGSMDEQERMERRLREVGVLCASVSPNGNHCYRSTHEVDERGHSTRPYTHPYSDDPDRVYYYERWT